MCVIGCICHARSKLPCVPCLQGVQRGDPGHVWGRLCGHCSSSAQPEGHGQPLEARGQVIAGGAPTESGEWGDESHFSYSLSRRYVCER